ncbi:hypothetical protein NDU88_007179 [Pleurodeles waltl]|uniref:Uncharacterized protein n=1 Tax=Pleurodeles waltl TaxID=8319 RepID=A0AAV7UP56_PLEWA|nr:hypothetical protein NDU88_007179 [Pleurodeles waltl]
MLFTVCLADSEKRDGCNCTRRTPATPPAPFGAGFSVAGLFPAGPVAAILASARRPGGKVRMAPAVFRPRSGHMAVPARRAATAGRQCQNEGLSLFSEDFLQRDEPASPIQPHGALLRIRVAGILGGDFYLRT